MEQEHEGRGVDRREGEGVTVALWKEVGVEFNIVALFWDNAPHKI